MKKKILIFTGLLTLVFLSSYLIAQKKSENEIKTFEEMIKKEIEERRKIEKEFFDSFFNDKFFSREYDPFKEIEEFRNRMNKIMGNDDKIFSNYFNKWFEDRIGDSNIKVEEKETDRQYLLIIDLSGQKDKNISVEVKKDYIRLYREEKKEEEREKDNFKYKSYSSSKTERYISIPDNLRGKEYEIETEKDKITIKFKK